MFLREKTVFVSFEDARGALLVLLGDVGEESWRATLATISWESFKTIIGGMGSFNDLWICVENHHQITDDKEPLANELLSCLTEVCWVTAQRGKLKSEDVIAACGTGTPILHGCRCLACGYAQASHQNIRAFIASIAVRNALKNGTDEAIRLWKSREDNKAFQDAVNLVSQSGIYVTKDMGWMRPCPSCKTDDTCVYRWRIEDGLFRPSSDNLPLKT